MTYSKWWALNLILIFFLQLSLFSCKKSPDPTVSAEFSSLLDCHQQMSWDSTKMNQTIIGTWNWQFVRCYFRDNLESYDVYKGFSVEFKADHTLVTKQNGIETGAANWNLVPNNYNSFILEINPFVEQLNGIVYFCDDRMEFANGYIDGCDNYFTRKK